MTHFCPECGHHIVSVPIAAAAAGSAGSLREPASAAAPRALATVVLQNLLIAEIRTLPKNGLATAALTEYDFASGRATGPPSIYSAPARPRRAGGFYFGFD